MTAMIATVAALVSALTVLISWWYNRQLSRAAVSLIKIKVNGKRVDKDKVSINFLFLFKNTGKETLKIRGLCLGHVDFKRKIFKQVAKHRY
jgi:hypothetical protein